MNIFAAEDFGADFQPAARFVIANPGSRTLGYNWAGPLARKPQHNSVVQFAQNYEFCFPLPGGFAGEGEKWIIPQHTGY